VLLNSNIFKVRERKKIEEVGFFGKFTTTVYLYVNPTITANAPTIDTHRGRGRRGASHVPP
jgi:hypothetical protein